MLEKAGDCDEKQGQELEVTEGEAASAVVSAEVAQADFQGEDDAADLANKRTHIRVGLVGLPNVGNNPNSPYILENPTNLYDLD